MRASFFEQLSDVQLHNHLIRSLDGQQKMRNYFDKCGNVRWVLWHIADGIIKAVFKKIITPIIFFVSWYCKLNWCVLDKRRNLNVLARQFEPAKFSI